MGGRDEKTWVCGRNLDFVMDFHHVLTSEEDVVNVVTKCTEKKKPETKRVSVPGTIVQNTDSGQYYMFVTLPHGGRVYINLASGQWTGAVYSAQRVPHGDCIKIIAGGE